jgi:hypothetical protein
MMAQQLGCLEPGSAPIAWVLVVPEDGVGEAARQALAEWLARDMGVGVVWADGPQVQQLTADGMRTWIDACGQAVAAFGRPRVCNAAAVYQVQRCVYNPRKGAYRCRAYRPQELASITYDQLAMEGVLVLGRPAPRRRRSGHR